MVAEMAWGFHVLWVEVSSSTVNSETCIQLLQCKTQPREDESQHSSYGSNDYSVIFGSLSSTRGDRAKGKKGGEITNQRSVKLS
ncbi:hypothetical protein F5X99DRAFT_372617 [Biscogniauxia marginata]|nr:hypothetical protein F5X99DRAFT_372617 [Biscogniauxia marginata]